MTVSETGVTIDKDGSITSNLSPVIFMKWLFAILCAAIVLTLTIKLCLRKTL